MKAFSEKAKFITTEFTPYYGNSAIAWGREKPPMHQHYDLVSSKGLPMFVKDFETESTDNAEILFTAVGMPDLYINGKRVSDDEMKLGWPDYLTRTLSDSYDISSLLKKGKNRILVVLSNGWYTGRIAGLRFGTDSPSFKVQISAGGKEIVTDGSWLCRVGGPIRTADLWDGEYRDGRETGFDTVSQPDYTLDENWKNATETEYKGLVTPYVGPKIRVREGLDRKCENITVFDGVEYNGSDFGRIHICNPAAKLPLKLLRGQKITLDLGQEIVGWLKIRVKGEKGTEIKIRFAEFLNDSGALSRGNDGPEGSVYTINLRSALGKAYYVLGSNNEETYEPTFTFFGFRFAEISCTGEVEFLDITGKVVGSDTKETGRIETSHKLVNKLFSNALWGQRGNYLSVPTDCPQRDERLGWTGDAQAFSATAAYNADVYSFFLKWMQDMRDCQSENGAYADVNPRVGCCTSEDACGWGDAGVIIPYNMYMIYGDDRIIREHYDSMEKYVEGLVTKYGFSGPIPRYGDWLAYDWCDNKFMSSVYFIHDLDLMKEMSLVMGKADRAEHYAALREKAHEYFVDNFMKDGRLTGTYQSEKVMCLAFNLVDESYAKELADELEAQIKANGDRLSTGFLATCNLCPALSKYDKNKTAFNLLMQRNEPAWLYSIDQGATTIWERWNSYTKEKGFGDVGMNSFNHYAYGAIVEWMYAYLAGIKPAKPGFEKIELSPVVDTRKPDEIPAGQEKMTYMKARFESRQGLIKSAWSTEDGFIYECTIPTDTLVKLPVCPKAKGLTLNGKKVDSPVIEGENYIFELKKGTYIFEQK